jgi:hypothetical protein
MECPSGFFSTANYLPWGFIPSISGTVLFPRMLILDTSTALFLFLSVPSKPLTVVLWSASPLLDPLA